jgi:hypothetical protein
LEIAKLQNGRFCPVCDVSLDNQHHGEEEGGAVAALRLLSFFVTQFKAF